MAYFYGQWKLNSRVTIFNSYSCTVDFTVGGVDYKGLTIGENGTYFVDENGDSERPDEEYGTDIIDFGEGACSTSIDKSFCDGFMMQFSSVSADAKIIGVEPHIYVTENLLRINPKDGKADAYGLYIDGILVGEYPADITAQRIDLSAFFTNADGEAHDINVTAYFRDDVFASDGKVIPFESAMSNTVTYTVPASNAENAYLVRESTLKDIADAIRAMRGAEEPIDAADFAQEILQIDSDEGGRATTTALDFTNYANGSFTETLSNGLVLTHTIEFANGTPTAVDNIEVTGV